MKKTKKSKRHETIERLPKTSAKTSSGSRLLLKIKSLKAKGKKMEIKTKKAAREAGLRTLDRLVMDYLYPREGESPLIIKGEAYYRDDQTEKIVTKTYACKVLGLSATGVQPVTTRKTRYPDCKWIDANMYRVSDLQPKRMVKPPKQVDLLLAIARVEKAAKKLRDLVKSHVREQRPGLEAGSRQRKEELTALKDVGISKAVGLGRLQHVGRDHHFHCYKGEGYYFRSTVKPSKGQASDMATNKKIHIESAPKSPAECRLVDAEFTIRSCCESVETTHHPTFIDERKLDAKDI